MNIFPILKQRASKSEWNIDGFIVVVDCIIQKIASGLKSSRPATIIQCCLLRRSRWMLETTDNEFKLGSFSFQAKYNGNRTNFECLGRTTPLRWRAAATWSSFRRVLQFPSRAKTGQFYSNRQLCPWLLSWKIPLTNTCMRFWSRTRKYRTWQDTFVIGHRNLEN
jgi:hypothetical protein